MNKRDFIILSIILNNGYLKYREIALKSGFSLGLINSSFKKLIEKGWLNEDFTATPQTIEYLQENKPHNAVILAAGPGIRMIPAQKTPKGLLMINNEPLIERLINQLHEIGITDISIVVGYMAESYEYLTEKYNVELIFNNEFTRHDNMYSLYLAKEKLENTYILPCDIWFSKNPFSKHEFFSWYGVSEFTHDSSFIRVNRKMELVKTDQGGNSMIGIAYANKAVAQKLVCRMESMIKKSPCERFIWEEALFDNEKALIPYARIMRGQSAYAIKTYEDLRDLDNESEHLKSKRIKMICDVFQVEADDITQIRALIKGMTNRLMRFSVDDEPYLLRIPGEGSNQLINRANETSVYKALENTDISDDVVYIDPVGGYKITHFMPNSRTCDPQSQEDTARCMALIHRLHDLNLQVSHRFDPFEQLIHYENLRNEKSSFFDYEQVRENIFSLKKVLDNLPKEECLCHIDSVCDNFLFVDDDQDVRLIDWEYAGMCDRYIDVAMFCIYAGYKQSQVDATILQYCKGKVDPDVKIKIYAYIAVCGLLWTVWCEYKAKNGVMYGEYMLSQYQYARKYYQRVMKLIQERNSD